jgi:ADP-heptose:LPS heptosyltransferase
MRDEQLLPANIGSIAVFRALHLGDILCATPALRAVRAAFPSAQITLIGLPAVRDLVSRLDGVDDLLEFPGFPGLPERIPDIAALPEFLRAAQARRFDLIVQMHDDGTLANPLCGAMGARFTAGFYPTGGWCPDAERYTQWIPRGAEVRRWLRLVQFLGMATRGERLELPVRADEQRRYRELASVHGLQRHRYVCVHPGARLSSRRWPAERFAHVGDWLAEQGFGVVITGREEERPIVARMRSAMRAPAIDLVGATDLGMFAALIGDARLLISNDTAASHIAAAMRTPSVVICAGSDPDRWAPLDSERHQVVHHPVICRPCAHVECPFDHPCAIAVTPEMVVQRARALLRKEMLRAA